MLSRASGLPGHKQHHLHEGTGGVVRLVCLLSINAPRRLATTVGIDPLADKNIEVSGRLICGECGANALQRNPGLLVRGLKA
jgi:hypothetical protein